VRRRSAGLEAGVAAECGGKDLASRRRERRLSTGDVVGRGETRGRGGRAACRHLVSLSALREREGRKDLRLPARTQGKAPTTRGSASSRRTRRRVQRSDPRKRCFSSDCGRRRWKRRRGGCGLLQSGNVSAKKGQKGEKRRTHRSGSSCS
jgi:hypothetical protein